LREKLSETLKGLPSETAVEIWFQDEMRIGQKNGCVRQWASRGSRPRQPVDQRYDSAYLFGAVCPARNMGAALALPFADTSAMQRHIDEISRHISPGAIAVVLTDNAGWHKAKAFICRRIFARYSFRQAAQSSMRRRTSGSTCARLGSQIASSPVTQRSSMPPVTHG
jgi:DDE superfamily endonuclease